jgi:hypothetical protein
VEMPDYLPCDRRVAAKRAISNALL